MNYVDDRNPAELDVEETKNVVRALCTAARQKVSEQEDNKARQLLSLAMIQRLELLGRIPESELERYIPQIGDISKSISDGYIPIKQARIRGAS
jgi:hypothetical protein